MIKSISIKTSVLLGTALVIGLSSCLKDKGFEDGKYQSVSSTNGTSKIIEIGLTGTDNTNLLALSLDASATDTTFGLIPVNLASSEPAQEDINVTLKKNDALISTYNTNNGTSYQVPTSSMFTILNANNVVTIPKGSYTGYLRIKFKTNDFIGAAWALGYSIASVDKAGYIISGNMNNGIVTFAIKNKYDGQYSMVIKTMGWNAYGIADGLTGTWPSNIGLVTAGANSVTLFDYLRNDYLQFAFSGSTTSIGAATAFGATTPMFTFDPATNKLVEVKNTTPDDGRGRTLFLNTTASAPFVSQYNPATKTITASYFMTQAGRPNQQIDITLKYVKSR